MRYHNIEVEAACRINEENGKIQRNEPFYMASAAIYHAHRGDRITVNDWAFLLGVATYGYEVADEYMYTYMYAEEQNWSRYRGDFCEAVFTTADYVFAEDCFFRVCLKKQDGNYCIPADAGRINEILSFHSIGEECGVKRCFEQEIVDTADAILQKTTGKALVFALLADSHTVINGTWKDTLDNIREVHRKVGFDGIIHLGDLQDGMLDKKSCRRIASECINDMRAICEPLYLVIGNHDTNYFKGNPQWLTEEEQYAVYGRFNDRYVRREGTRGWYYADYEHVKLRLIFLASFNHLEAVRYGFPAEEVDWLRQTLEATPDTYQVLVFSHDAPLARLDYWASDIRNGEALTQVLETYNAAPGRNVLGFIHGHTHADYIYTERNFPIISVGCSKCEYFPDKKPEGSTRQMRRLNDVTQDLWDALIVLPEQKRLEFVRFGAGEDRTVPFGH